MNDIKNKKYAVILLIFTFMLVVGCGKSQALPEEKNEVPEEEDVIFNRENSFNIMTYNIYQSDFDKDPQSPKSWAFRKEMVIGLLEKYKVDIVCGQEDNPNQGEDIVNSLNFAKVGVSRITGTESGNGEFNAIYFNKSRFEVVESGYFWFSETPTVPSKSWDAQTSSSCNWVLMRDKTANNEFYIFNTHLDYIGVITRQKSALMLKEEITSITDGKPVIMTGDMNCMPDSQPITVFNTFLNNASEISKVTPTGPKGTYNAFNIAYDISKYRFDYIFVSDGIDVFTHTTAVDSQKGYYPSDHFPVVCEVKIKE